MIFFLCEEYDQELHKAKYPALFVKLDIFKAFDSVSWPFLSKFYKYLVLT